jgi:hypothetical protein
MSANLLPNDLDIDFLHDIGSRIAADVEGELVLARIGKSLLKGNYSARPAISAARLSQEKPPANEREALDISAKTSLAYSRMEEGTLALRACSCKSSSCFFASSSFFCLSAICSLNCASSLSHELALRRRLPASA